MTIAYEHGRLARLIRLARCWRVLTVCHGVSDPDDWYRGWDDMDMELTRKDANNRDQTEIVEHGFMEIQ